eukprot:3612749-Pyramimonas_sp.AAC.2
MGSRNMTNEIDSMTSKALFSSSATADEAKTTLQVAYQVTQEARSDGLLDDNEFKVTVAELKATFRSQLLESGHYSEAMLRRLENEAINAANIPMVILSVARHES